MLCFLLVCSYFAIALAQAPPAPSVISAVNIGDQISNNGTFLRDLGFSGMIGSNVYDTFGDSHKCKADLSSCDLTSASDGIALATANPDRVNDFPFYIDSGGSPKQFCPFYPDEHNQAYFGIGITNVVEINHDTGILFFLTNNRTSTPGYIVGAGVAAITFNGTTPLCTRLTSPAQGEARQYWWDGATEPYYGDHSSVLGPDGYIYAFGGSTDIESLFVARAKATTSYNMSTYSYWNGTLNAWTPTRLNTSHANPSANASAVLHNFAQGQVYWSVFHQAYVFLYDYAGSIYATAAYRPEGPWSGPSLLYVGVCNDGLCDYSPSAQPWWDATGKTLVVGYTSPPHGVKMLNLTWAGDPAPRSFPDCPAPTTMGTFPVNPTACPHDAAAASTTQGPPTVSGAGSASAVSGAGEQSIVPVTPGNGAASTTGTTSAAAAISATGGASSMSWNAGAMAIALAGFAITN